MQSYQKRVSGDEDRTFYRFDEFEYAKEAVHLEVEEYILKPVNSVELINIFTKLKIKAGSGDK